MAYLSLYRKYRSQTFGDLVGQDHVVRTLQNGIASSRIAHSYLFTGPRGTGKTSSARLLAKALCCESGPTPEPCNTCSICQEITNGSLIDVFEMDAASESGVEEVRQAIVEGIGYKPNFARYRVFIIDEVHDLSPKAFDALLKTIEEPPEHVIFILATTEYNKVPPTIRSRCQKFEFHRASMSDLVARLTYVAESEGTKAEPAALTAIARMADGGFRDALTLLEQAILTSDGNITLQHVYDQLGLISEEVVDEVLLAMRDGDVARIVERLSEIARLGRDPRAVLESMLYRLSDLTRAIFAIDVGASQDPAREAATHETATRLGRSELLRLRAAISEAHRVIRDISLPRLWLEAELTRVALAGATASTASAPAPQAAVAHVQPAAEPATPEPKPVRAETPAPKPEPAPVATDPVAASSERSEDRLWGRVLAELPRETPISMKLVGSRLLELDGTKAKVEVKRRTSIEWMTDDPRRLAFLVKTIQKVTGAEWMVSFVPAAPTAPSAEPVAVELPAEGQKLAQMAKDVFGG